LVDVKRLDVVTIHSGVIGARLVPVRHWESCPGTDSIS